MLPVSEAVLKVVAFVLQDVERLILDLPPCPAAGCKLDDIAGTHRQIGDEAVAVGGLAASVDDLDLEPVDRQCVAAVAQPLCCANIAPPAACQLVESSTDPDGGWHTKACHPVQRVASKLCFDLLTGQNPSVCRPMMVL